MYIQRLLRSLSYKVIEKSASTFTLEKHLLVPGVRHGFLKSVYAFQTQKGA